MSARPSGERGLLRSVWGDLTPVVAAMVAARPAVAARILLAPPEAAHAVAAFLHAQVARGDADPAALAGAVATTHARRLLRDAIAGCDPRLYRLLGRCGEGVHGPDFYTRLNAALAGPLRAALLLRPRLSPDTLDAAARIAADPVLAACGAAALAHRGHLEDLEAALAFLRAHGLARDIEALPPGSGWRAVAARVAADLARAATPPAPWPIPPGWSQPARWREVAEAGRLAGNCLASLPLSLHLLDQWMAGRAVVLAATVRPGLATVERCGPTVWRLTEIDARAGGLAAHIAARVDLEAALVAGMASAGHRLLAREPVGALRALLETAEGAGR